jgi:hypothetical protein
LTDIGNNSSNQRNSAKYLAQNGHVRLVELRTVSSLRRMDSLFGELSMMPITAFTASCPMDRITVAEILRESS